jgi:hypothetical protein
MESQKVAYGVGWPNPFSGRADTLATQSDNLDN